MRNLNPESGRTAVWFFRIIGLAVLASVFFEQLLVEPGDRAFAFLAGPLYLLAWVGSFLVYLDHGRTHATFAVPFALVLLTIALLALASLLSLASDSLPAMLMDGLRSAARIANVLAAVAFAVIGWTTHLTPRKD